MNSILPQVQRPVIREVVSDMLRASFLSGVFSPGEALSEPELASQLKISRGPVREALLILAEEGLVTHTPNRGFFVIQLKEEDSKHIEMVRCSLEALALTEARKRVNPDILADLEGKLDKMLAYYRVADVNNWTTHDQAFHRAIWDLSGNPWLVTALQRVTAPYFAFSIAYKILNPKLSYELMRERHDLFLDFLKGTTSKTADGCVRFHFDEES